MDPFPPVPLRPQLLFVFGVMDYTNCHAVTSDKRASLFAPVQFSSHVDSQGLADDHGRPMGQVPPEYFASYDPSQTTFDARGFARGNAMSTAQAQGSEKGPFTSQDRIPHVVPQSVQDGTSGPTQRG
jgi:hypothetical protein